MTSLDRLWPVGPSGVVVRRSDAGQPGGHAPVPDGEWRDAVAAAGLVGDRVVPADAQAPHALEAWLSDLVGPGGIAGAGHAWVLTADANADQRRYVGELLGSGVAGEWRRAGALVMSPEQARLLVENGLRELAPAALLLVDAQDADSTVAALDRGDRAAAVATAAMIVLRLPDDTVWLAQRGAASTPAAALASLPVVVGRAPHARASPAAVLSAHWGRLLVAVVIAGVGAGATITLVRHDRGSPDDRGGAIPAATARPAPATSDEVIPRPSSALLAYDATHRELVLVGCCDPASHGDGAITWTWDGTAWTPHHDAVPPPVVAGSGAISQGPAAGPVVLFDTNTESDTWTWGGASWTLLHTGPNPPHGSTVMAYDRVSLAVVALIGDTWTWDRLGWHAHAGATSGFAPTGSVATEPATGRVLEALDANDGSGRLVLRRWDGAAWAAVPAAAGPTLESGFQVAGDDASGDLVYLGPPVSSFYPDLRPETWVWDGHAWSRPAVDATPTHGGRLVGAFGHALFVEDAVGGRPPTIWRWTGHGWRALGPTDRLTPNPTAAGAAVHRET